MAPTLLSTSMNDCGEVQKNAGTAPISAAAEYGRDGRMTSGLNGVRGYISDCNPSQITDYLLRENLQVTFGAEKNPDYWIRVNIFLPVLKTV